MAHQIVVLLAATQGLLDDVPVDRIADAEETLRRMADEELAELGERIAAGEELGEQDREAILSAAERALAPHRGAGESESGEDEGARRNGNA